MLNIRMSMSIDRSPQDVFDYVADPANNAKWQGPTEFARWTSEGPPGVGSTLHSVARFLGRKMEFKYEVSRWDPPKTLVLRSIEGSVPFQSIWGFEPDGEGGTELTLDSESEMSGLLKLAEGLVRRQFEKQLQADFNALKGLLEAEQE